MPARPPIITQPMEPTHVPAPAPSSGPTAPRPAAAEPRRHPRTLRRTMHVGLALLAGLLLISALFGWVTTTRSSAAIGTTLREVQADAALTSRLSAKIVEECRTAARYIRTRDPGSRARFIGLLTETRTIHRDIGRLRNQSTAEVLLVAQIREDLSRIEDTYARAHALADLGREEEARAHEAEVESLVDEILAKLEQLHASKAAKVGLVSSDLQATTTRGIWVMVLLVGGAVLVAAYFARASLGTLLVSLRILLAHADELSRGNLSVRTPPESMPGGEFRGLIDALNHAGASLARLAEAEAALHRAERLQAIGLLVSGVAHELNNPLAAMLMTVELMQMDATGETAEDLELIRGHANRARGIVQALLSVVRDDGPGYRELEPGALLDETARLLRSQVAQKGATLSLAVDRPLPSITGDSHALQQVLTNLVLNAADAAGPGGEVSITARWRGVTVEIAVEDTGPGIPPEVMPRIFEAFFTTKPVGQGTGLGLSISRGIVERHRGTLHAEARTAAGATGARLVLTLPCEELPTISTGVPAVLLSPAWPVQTSGSSAVPRILVVDDEPAIRSTLTRLFDRRGWRVDEAADGRDAFRKIDAAEHAGDPYAIVLSDLRMPGATGMDLHELLSREHPDTLRRLIYATGDNVSPDVVAFIGTTTCPVLDKPFDLTSLLRVVTTTLPETLRHAA